MKYKIIIIDDDPLILKIMSTVLSPDIFEIKTYETTNNIIPEIKRMVPDLILLDIKLCGVSGIDIIKSIRKKQHFSTIPIIAFTSYAMKEDKENFLKLGFDNYLAKPIDTRKVTGQILGFLKK